MINNNINKCVDASTINDAGFLLDTSALYSLSHVNIKSLRDKGVSLYGSPYSCWELLCHLDEPNNFPRQKAILLKFQYLNILDSPQSEIEESLFGKDHGRISDNELIKASLAALQASDSLDEYYSSYLRDSKGHYRKIVDVSRRAKLKLSELEMRYVAFASQLLDHLRTRSDIADSTVHTNLILNMVLGEYNKLKEQHPSIPLSDDEVIRHFYIYCGYIFYRSVYRIKRGGNVDKNDYEDANLCKHLRTNSIFQLVTGDCGTLDALRRLISVTQNDNEFNIRLNLRVYPTSDLEKLAQVD
jgi:hypothetical protein